MIPLPNEVRHAERDKVDSYFNDHIQRKNFYTQAKEGRLGEHHNQEQEIMQRYFENVQGKKGIPNPAYA
jgi:hypothetical protein